MLVLFEPACYSIIVGSKSTQMNRGIVEWLRLWSPKPPMGVRIPLPLRFSQNGERFILAAPLFYGIF